MDRITETLLDTIRVSLGLNIGTTRYRDLASGRELWLVNARSADGLHSWTAKAEDGYDAACELARLVGFDLMDG